MAALGVPPITLAHIANHRSMTHGGVTMSVYAKYDYGREKRAALTLWADRLAAIVGDKPIAAVLPMALSR
jgi:hypothetical protein